MERINNFLNQIYGNSQSTMIFYIVLGAIALFFIVLIIATLRSSKKEKEIREEKEELQKDQEESKEAEDAAKQNEPLTETQVFNNILMGKDEQTTLADELFDNKKSDVYLEKPDVIEEEKSEEEPVMEEEVAPSVNVPEEAHEEVVETPKEEYQETVNELNLEVPEEAHEEVVETPAEEYEEVKTEEPEEEKPVLNSVEVDEIGDGPLEIREGFTIEMPKVKPMDIDTYLSGREEKEESNDGIIKLSNDELKDRLAKLKEKKEQKEVPNEELKDLMKTMGLEDTTVIPKIEDEERHILGR